jgi:diguanylate cyclase (GGDEF)-like protein
MSSDDQDTAVNEVAREAPVAAQHGCLLVIYQRDGAGAGKRIELDRLPLRIGREDDNELVIEEECVSRRHARIEQREGRIVLMDAGSTNGTLLNGVELSEIVQLTNGDRITVGSAILKYLAASDMDALFYEQVFASVQIDQLTGLRRKEVFMDQLQREVSRARRYDRALSALFIDIDRFKSVNTDHGHMHADQILKSVAGCILANCRANDTAARFGGEELVVLLPETDVSNAALIAERVRAAVEACVVNYRDKPVSVTVSIGCAEYLESEGEESHLVERRRKNVRGKRLRAERRSLVSGIHCRQPSEQKARSSRRIAGVGRHQRVRVM